MDCISSLLGDPNFAEHLLFSPERHYTDQDMTVRLYHDMHTGKWWWETQVSQIFSLLFCLDYILFVKHNVRVLLDFVLLILVSAT